MWAVWSAMMRAQQNYVKYWRNRTSRYHQLCVCLSQWYLMLTWLIIEIVAEIKLDQIINNKEHEIKICLCTFLEFCTFSQTHFSLFPWAEVFFLLCFFWGIKMNFRFSKIRYINIYRTTYRRVYSYLQIRAREMYSAET